MSKKLFPWTKQIVITIMAASTLLLFTHFRHVLFQCGVEVYLNMKYPVEGGWKLDYEKISFLKDRVSFSEIKLASKRQLVEIRLEKLDLVCKSFKTISFDHGIFCNNPEIDIYRSEGESDISFSKILQMSLSNYQIDIDKGQVFFHDSDKVTPVYFSLISDEKQRSLGTFYLCDNPDVIEQAQVMMNVCQWPQELIFEFEMQDANVAWISEISSHFLTKEKAPWEITKGTLNGHLWLGLTGEGQISQMTSILCASEVALIDEENGLEVFSEELSFDYSYPARKKNDKIHSEIWWQNSVLKAQVKGGKIGFKDPESMIDFALCDLVGDVNFSSFKDSEINLQGYVDHKGQISPIILSGNPSMVDKDTLDLDLKLLLEPESKSLTHLNLSIAMENDDQCIIRGRLKDLGIEQIAMFQHIIGFGAPAIRDVKIHSGEVTCEVSLRLSHGKIHKLLLDNLIADNLQIYWQSKDALGFCSHLEGSAQLDFLALPKFRLPTWEVSLENGDLIIGRESENPLSFSDINMQIFMCRDVFEPSWIKTTHRGLQANIDLVGYFTEADISLDLVTTGDRLLAFFVDEKEKEYDLFKDYRFETKVGLQRKLGCWNVEGNVDLSILDKWKDNVEFGFYLSDRVLTRNLSEIIPLLKESVSKGTFRGENISVEFLKLSNYCFGLNWATEGIVSIEGTFDSEDLDLDFTTSQLNFFSPIVDVKIDSKLDGNQDNRSEGKFHYNWVKNTWNGFFPLRNATIYEKTLDSYFYETNADVMLDGKKLKLVSVETESEGVWFEGNLGLDFQKGDGFALRIETDSIVSTAKQMQNFLSHIPECEIASFPFDGRIKSGEEGFFFIMEKSGDQILLDWEVHLQLAHGTFEIKPHLKMQDLAFDLDCSYSEKTAMLSNISGVVPSSLYDEGYTLNGRYLHFHLDEEFPELFFDLRIENHMMDLARFMGSLHLKDLSLHLDEPHCHFFGAQFSNVALQLNEKYQPILAQAQFTFPCNEISNYCRFISDFNFLPMLGIFENQSFLKNEGFFGGELAYEKEKWTIGLEGKDIKFGGREISDMKFHGSKYDKHWKIDQCTIDDISLKADLLSHDNTLVIKKGNIESLFGEASFKGGQFDSEKKRLRLLIDESFINGDYALSIEGQLNCKGFIDINLDPTMIDCIAKAHLTLAESVLGENQFIISSDSDLELTYFLEQGLVLKDAHINLRKDDIQLLLDIPTLNWNFEEKICQGYRMQAIFTKPFLQTLFDQNWFDSAVDISYIPSSKEDFTKMIFDFEWSPKKFQIGGLLDKGSYQWMDKEYEIEVLSFNLDKQYLKISLQTPFMDRDFTLNCKIQPNKFFETNLEAFEMKEGSIIDPMKPSLLMDCKLKGPDGFSIAKIEGNVFGVDFAFLPIANMQDSFSMSFIGNAKIDAVALNKVLEGDVKELIDELQFGRGYELQGELTLEKENWKQSFFDGFFKGKDFDLLGYEFKTLQSLVHIDYQGAHFTNFKLSDNAVSADIDEMKIQSDEDEKWKIHVPELKIADLRPSLLRKRVHSFQRLKPFHIKNMVFQDVHGDLADISTFTGKGQLNFINTFKQGHNLLDIPLEIISRLGLDMGLLVPIQGEMDYILKDGKVVFTKLRNSFSESKRSYFYLWNKSESFVDFRGNMHIDIRMKQYVLFKITELFILSINGTLEQPRFSLR